MHYYWFLAAQRSAAFAIRMSVVIIHSLRQSLSLTVLTFISDFWL